MQGCPKGTCFGLADIVGEDIFAYQNIFAEICFIQKR